MALGTSEHLQTWVVGLTKEWLRKSYNLLSPEMTEEEAG